MGEFTVPGEPVAMGRPRFTKSGRVYIPKKTQDAINNIASYAAENIKERDIQEPIHMSVVFYFKRPKRMKRGPSVYKPTKPDIDNCLKTVMDGINRSGMSADKLYHVHPKNCQWQKDAEPRTVITLFRYTDEDRPANTPF
jgi:Holliday junction resolvase RusA-like endonuclease